MAVCWGAYIERVGWGFGATAIRLILLRATQLRHVQSTPDAAAIEAHGAPLRRIEHVSRIRAISFGIWCPNRAIS
jgi:hypothetical protein